MKKIFTLLLTLLLSLLVISNVFADETIYMDGSLFYTINNDEITIVKYVGNDDDVTVPMKIGGYYVTKIADDSFTGKNINKITLPYTVGSVSNGAFDNISNVDIKYYNKNNEIIEKDKTPTQDEDPAIHEDPVIDDPVVDEPTDDPVIDDPIIEEEIKPGQKKDGDKGSHKGSSHSNIDSSLNVKEGDTIEQHSDMISEMHTTIDEIMGDEQEDISHTQVDNNIDTAYTNNTYKIVYILIAVVCIMALLFVLFRRKKK